MTVKELIEALSQYPEDMEVRIHSDDLWKSIMLVWIIPHTIIDFNHIENKDFIGIQ